MMLALRRAVNPLRSHGCLFGASKFHISGNDNLEHVVVTSCGATQVVESSKSVLTSKRWYQSSFSSLGNRCLSSHAGARSDEEENNDNGVESDGELELCDNEMKEALGEATQNGADNLESEDAPKSKTVCTELFEVIRVTAVKAIPDALDMWAKEGKPLDRSMILQTMANLRKRRMSLKAKLFAEWLQANEGFSGEEEYAYAIDAISRSSRVGDAEKYMMKIPKAFKGQKVYDAMLFSLVSQLQTGKAEKLFEEMKDLGLISVIGCNQMLVLYKRDNAKKCNVLSFMENNDISPNLATYRILIDSKGKDIQGIEKLLEDMKAKGIEPDLSLQAVLAGRYISAGLNEMAEEIMKKIEVGDLNTNRIVCRTLLPLYAELGKSDDVDKIWKICEPNAWRDEHQAAILAMGKLGRIKEAEEIFNNMNENWKNNCFHTLLDVYLNNKLLGKAKNLAKDRDNGGHILPPWTMHALLKLYLETGEVEKADLILTRVTRLNVKPRYLTYFSVMEAYAKKGDIHNTEKIFHWIRRSGYFVRLPIYQCLVQAYINGKSPAYGLRERIKADNIIPNRDLGLQLNRVDAFRKSAEFID
ncbi:hypothetical protein GIB67_006963 [Kingdonia uniflora]|uniref:Pentatricopeptide repeat-containing protein n=1 Tax=Kingdonia uniflora TaxID=39325 RepID=A0A7J7NZE2_9MAGN|nr:hypothetical protein GIB67_006963 [Kingdonia uniflora]